MFLVCIDQGAARGLVATVLVVDFMQLLFLAAFIPANWRESCSQPVREWNVLYASRLALEALYLSALCLNAPASIEVQQRMSRVRLGTLILWSNLALCILGAIWLLSGTPECLAEAPWQTRAAIAILCFNATLILVPLLCLALHYFTTWAAANPSTPAPMHVDRLKRRRSISFDECMSSIPESTKLAMACMICLCEYDPSDCLLVLCCMHHGHAACLSQWLMTKANCPMCRRRVPGSPRSIRPEEMQLMLQRSLVPAGSPSSPPSSQGGEGKENALVPDWEAAGTISSAGVASSPSVSVRVLEITDGKGEDSGVTKHGACEDEVIAAATATV